MIRMRRSVLRRAAAIAVSGLMWSIAAAPLAWAKDRTDTIETASISAGPTTLSQDSRARNPVPASTVTTSMAPLDMRLLTPSAFEDWDETPATRLR